LPLFSKNPGWKQKPEAIRPRISLRDFVSSGAERFGSAWAGNVIASNKASGISAYPVVSRAASRWKLGSSFQALLLFREMFFV
jgi:hypothetical protein